MQIMNRNSTEEPVDAMCKCGHPEVSHCASLSREGNVLVAVAGAGMCLGCEAEYLAGEMKEESEMCSGFVFDHWIYRGDEDYKRFEELLHDE